MYGVLFLPKKKYTTLTMPKAHFKSMRMLVDRTPEFTFGLSPADLPDFRQKAGQNIDITIQLTHPLDDKGKTRTFSISSAPSRLPEFTIATRLSGSAFKSTLMDMQPGTEIEVTPPGGQFVLPKSAEFPLVFIAGGIGVTPFMSMLAHATEHSLPHQIHFIYSNRNETAAPYLPELHTLATQNKNITLHLNYGPLTKELVQEKTKDLQNPTYYIAGPVGMAAMAQKTLIEIGISEDSILIEDFPGYESKI